jgi:peptidoglycan hydrolase-like protein with peptidoglycan-binding domain
MRTRYTRLSLLALVLGSVAVGYAAQGTQAPKNGAANSSGTTSRSTAARVTLKKPSASGVHATKTSTSARRRVVVAHPAVVHAQMAPAPSRISEIQDALSREGAYQGEPNGKWDATTVDAMKQFQNDHGLTPSGKIDALTLQKLGLGSQVSGLGAPLPLAVPQASAADSGDQTEHP